MATTNGDVTLTAKQKKVLGLFENGKTVKQIARTMKIQPAGVYGYFRRLRELGLIETEENKPTSNGNGIIPTPEFHDVQTAVLKAIEAEQVNRERLRIQDDDIRSEIAAQDLALREIVAEQEACDSRIASLEITRETVGA